MFTTAVGVSIVWPVATDLRGPFSTSQRVESCRYPMESHFTKARWWNGLTMAMRRRSQRVTAVDTTGGSDAGRREWPSFSCTDEDLEAAAAAFARDGAVCIRQAFSPEECALVAQGMEQTLSKPGPLGEWIGCGTSRFFSDLASWRRIGAYESFIRTSGAAELTRRLMRSEISVFYHEHTLVKEAGLQPATPWHHDQSYYPVDGTQLCSIWLPVDPVPSPEASLQFLQGSHSWGQWYVPRKFASGCEYGRVEENGSFRDYLPVPDVDQLVAEGKAQIMAWRTTPGDCVVFHGLTVHGTQRSLGRNRRVLSTRWVGEDARLAGRPWKFSPPLTGSLGFGDHLWQDGDTFPTLGRR